MIKTYKSIGTEIKEIDFDKLEKGCWIDVSSPTTEELKLLSERTNIMIDLLTPATDEEESPRIEIETDQILVLIDVPLLRSNRDYETLPLGVIITENYVVTICLEVNAVISDFTTSQVATIDPSKRTRFLFQLLFKSAGLYLKYIRNINRRTNELEEHLRQSMQNDEIFKMLDLEKSLTYFSASLRSNYIVIERLLRLRSTNQVSHIIKMYEEDEEYLEDVIIEYKQAIDMVGMYSRILSSMLEVFASIISNNLNRVMKILASLTIIISVPTMISGLWGMNVPVPLTENEYGFLLVGGCSFLIAFSAAYLLWKKKMF